MKQEFEWVDFWLLFRDEWPQFVASIKELRGTDPAQDAKGWNLQSAPGN